MNRHPWLAAVLCVGLVTSALSGQSPQVEQEARKRYESGVGFLEQQRYAEALRDFNDVVNAYQGTAAAGNALVRMAEYYLDVARDLGAASKRVEAIKKYPLVAPAGYLLSGRIYLASRKPEDVDSARAEFDRVPMFYPKSDLVPEARYYSGEAFRLGRDIRKALERYQDVVEGYPTSVWSARALLGEAACLVELGQASAAFTVLQRLRVQFQGDVAATAEVATALDWNTILYRLYIRPPQPSFTYSGRDVTLSGSKFNDVTDLDFDTKGNLLVAHRGGVSVFNPGGAFVRTLPSDAPIAVAVSPSGKPVAIRNNTFTLEGSPTVTPSIPDAERRPKPMQKIAAAVSTWNRNWLVADPEARSVQVFSSTFSYIKSFLDPDAGRLEGADRLAVNARDDVAVLQRNRRSIHIADRDGKGLARVSQTGKEFTLEEPVDIVFDALGHLYVLDKGQDRVWVFTPQGDLRTAFTIPPKTPGAFRNGSSFAIDSAGRLYIYDSDVNVIQVYQ